MRGVSPRFVRSRKALTALVPRRRRSLTGRVKNPPHRWFKKGEVRYRPMVLRIDPENLRVFG